MRQQVLPINDKATPKGRLYWLKLEQENVYDSGGIGTFANRMIYVILLPCDHRVIIRDGYRRYNNANFPAPACCRILFSGSR